MKQSKLPFMQFYTADWLTDTALSRCSFEAKGFWIDLLCFLWRSETRGKIVGSYEDIANLMGCDSDTVEKHILRLKNTNTANVTISNGVITVVNRRMEREEKARQSTRSRQSKFRQREKLKDSNANITDYISYIIYHITDIRAYWNETFKETEIAKISLIVKNSGREKKLITRLKDDYFLNNYKKAIDKIVASDFLIGKGENRNYWRITFDWFISNDNNYIKILEGNYDNKTTSRSTIKGESDYNSTKQL